MRGARGRWYRELVADPVGGLVGRAMRYGVRALPAADPVSIRRVSDALERKYGRRWRASTDEMLQPTTLPTTLRLIPEGSDQPAARA